MTIEGSTKTATPATSLDEIQEIWFTRCPVPTATGIAADLGWFAKEFEPDGVTVSSLQERPASSLSGQHFEHGLATLFREGGNVPALWTRSRGQATRLIGLTWIDERQAILVLEDSAIANAADLKGRRIALPDRPDRSVDFWRAMALHGFAGALRSVGLTLEDAVHVDVHGSQASNAHPAQGWGPELDALVAGEVDAVYVKGAAAVDAASSLGARVLVDLDTLDDRRLRVNNGTPRPITVHQDLLDARPDLVSRFLSVLLAASDWAKTHPDELTSILQAETGAGADGVHAAYRGEFHRHLHPSLSVDRLDLLVQQKDFLLEHGFLEGDVDIAAWAAPEPLLAARELLATKAS